VDATTAGILGLAAGSMVLLALAWAIGVLGHLRLIDNYRAHPERFPDAQGLGRWMGYTLAAGGLSLGLCAVAWGSGAIGEDGVGIWAAITAPGIVVLSLLGIARHRRVPGGRGGRN
jgi:hypothetical protein